MNNPLKLIHKFKNNNKRTQYITYIFLGNLVEDNIIKLLNNIKSKNFYDTLLYLSKNKLEELENKYKEKWYIYFIKKQHLIEQKNIIIKNTTKKRTLIDKFGKEWFQKHIETESYKKIEYSFAANYYDYLIARNKIKTQVKKKEMDFTTYQQEGGGGDEINEDNIDEKLEEETEEEPTVKTNEDLDDEVAEDFDLEELTKLYSMDDIENTKIIKDTAKLIGEAVKDSSWTKDTNTKNSSMNHSLYIRILV